MVSQSIFRPATSFALAATLSLAAIDPASAQQSKRSESERAAAPVLTGPAVMAVVSIREQRVSVYDADGNAVRARVSSGQTDYETPVGIYSILQKNREHYSNLYDDASMPFMQRLTWSGIALHAGQLPGYPASHGCVRLPYKYAEGIFDQSKLGMRVIVARNNVAPVAISHPLLFKPTTAPGGARPVTTQIAYEPGAEPQAVNASPFEADVRAWPGRLSQLEALRAAAAEKAPAAEAATARFDEVKKIEKAKAAERAKTAKALKRAASAKKAADERVSRAARRIAEAKTEKARKSAERDSAKAIADAAKANEKFLAAKAPDDAAAAALAQAAEASAAAEATKTAAVNVAQEAKRKTLPVSIFVSLKTQRLYVRQGNEPVLDVPVTISEPEEPIGTFVYTAVDYIGDGNDVRWTAVSTGPRSMDEASYDDDDYDAYDRYRSDRKRRNPSKKESLPTPTDIAAAKAALDRLTIPADVKARASEYVWPGTSLIVSDEDVSKETGKATDFVVLISGEPQGGIKKRPRQPPPDYYRYYDEDYYYSDRRYRRGPRYTPFFSFW
jgi:hypothetical protein